jgi:hypothetical protein
MTVEVLPAAGIITVKALAEFLRTDPSNLQQKLSDNNIPVLKLSKLYNKRLVRLEDLRKATI